MSLFPLLSEASAIQPDVEIRHADGRIQKGRMVKVSQTNGSITMMLVDQTMERHGRVTQLVDGPMTFKVSSAEFFRDRGAINISLDGEHGMSISISTVPRAQSA